MMMMDEKKNHEWVSIVLQYFITYHHIRCLKRCVSVDTYQRETKYENERQR